MAGDAMKNNHGLFTIFVLRMVIIVSAASLYLRGLLSPTHEDAA